jgi:hypothetical protein
VGISEENLAKKNSQRAKMNKLKMIFVHSKKKILKDINFKLNSHICGEMGIFFFLLNIRFISSIF